MGKIYNGIMGLVVGDAFGVPFEFKKRDSFKVPDKPAGYGTYNKPAGTWSDDSSLTLATLESLQRLKTIDLTDIMENFKAWLNQGEFTPDGEVFDCGNTTFNAINKYKSGFPITACGCHSIYDNGNGSLMRILPLAFTKCSMADVDAVSGLTHSHEIAKQGCRIYITIARWLLKGMPLYLLHDEPFLWVGEYKPIKDQFKVGRDEIKSSGYVVDTLAAALWCFKQTNNYKDCIRLAVGLGGDTDTIAAVAGGLAGIAYGCGGEDGIPYDWIDTIVEKDWIAEICGYNDSIF